MGGTGDIGGGCVVSFAVDAESKGDRKRRWSAFDKYAQKQANKTKTVTITVPQELKNPAREGASYVYTVSLASCEGVHVEWD